jgi:Holliday junction resolvase
MSRELFRDDGFPVHHNPATARPMQTDIFAISYDMLLLIEVKDRRRLIFKHRV